MNAARQKRASVHTLGCRLNQAESAILTEQLYAAGYDVVPFGEPADLGIINTCTVTGEADSKSRQLVRSFIRKNPHAYTAVIGCYAQMGHKALSEIEGIDLVVGNQEKLNVLAYVAQGKNDYPLVVRDRIERDDFTIEVIGNAPTARRANLKIQDGCDFMCSFCIIPFARGRARSREWHNLMEEARQLVERGAKELVLTGVNVGTYDDNGRSILDVIDALDEIPGLARVRISSIEPTTIPEPLLDRMNDPDHVLVPHLHVPLQSGSNTILQAMKRRYTRESYLEFVQRARATVSGICIGTDIMVGMPGESGADFEDTVLLLERAPIDYAHVFTFSERAGTPAARMAGKVSPESKTLRSARVRKTSDLKRRAFYERHLGHEVEVLFEHGESGTWIGHTGNYIRVAVRSHECLENELRMVRLDEICGDIVSGRLSYPRGKTV